MSMGKNILINFISGLLLVLLLAGGYVLLGRLGYLGGSGDGGTIVASSTRLTDSPYQAVFLTNGQVYFGRVANINNQYAKLNEIYYLIVQPGVQQQQEEPQPQSNFTLIKLGDELHGPMDEMVINRDQILFIEPLKADSQVVKAIEDFKARGGQ